MLGVIARPLASPRLAVVIVVGGPQYRAGSHRQFVMLSRALALGGVAALRFDLRGMGDSEGARGEFWRIDDDIDAAIGACMRALPELRGVVLWGLCDGATACVLYPSNDRRVLGRVLVNPWIRTESVAARARLTGYYRRRILSPRFWRKIVRGGVDLAGAFSGVASSWRTSRRPPSAAPAPTWQERFVAALDSASRPWLVVLSGRDAVADEFRLVAASDRRLAAALRAQTSERIDVDGANHTFSGERWRGEITGATLGWLRRCCSEPGGLSPALARTAEER